MNNKNTFDRFVETLPTLILSLFLGILIWANAIRAGDPEDNSQFTLPLNVIREPNQIILNRSVESVQVDLTAPRSALNELDISKLEAYIDLTDQPNGENEYEVLLRPDLPGINAIKIFPDVVTIDADHTSTRIISVTVDLRGTAARGFERGEPVVEPSTVTVTGPERVVNQLNEIKTTVFLEDNREPVEFSPRLVLYDKQGNIVSPTGSNLTFDNDRLIVSVPVVQSDGFVDITLSPQLIGDPARGYRLTGVTVEPRKILVQVPTDSVDNLRFIETSEFDISGLRETTTVPVDLLLPDGVVLDQPQNVKITVSVEPIISSASITTIPDIRALGPELTATLDIEEVRVALSGPLEVLESLQPEDVRVTLDLTGLTTGTFILDPSVTVLFDTIEVRSWLPRQITVFITQTVPITETITETSSAETSYIIDTLAPTPIIWLPDHVVAIRPIWNIKIIS